MICTMNEPRGYGLNDLRWQPVRPENLRLRTGKKKTENKYIINNTVLTFVCKRLNRRLYTYCAPLVSGRLSFILAARAPIVTDRWRTPKCPEPAERWTTRRNYPFRRTQCDNYCACLMSPDEFDRFIGSTLCV